jgi:uncharacterized protein YndB with AHSA1/START domain
MLRLIAGQVSELEVGEIVRATQSPRDDVVDGQVRTVEPNKTLTYTWDTKDLRSVITWTLTPTSTGTHLRMEHSGFRPDQQQAYQGAKYGWQQFFANLEQVLARTD